MTAMRIPEPTDLKHITERVARLDAKGTAPPSQGPNAYVVLRPGYAILIDAATSALEPVIDRLDRDGCPARAVILTDCAAANCSSGLEMLRARGVQVHMHPGDAGRDPGPPGTPRFDDPTRSVLLADAGLEIVHVPGRSEGAVMVYLGEDGGVLLCGASALPCHWGPAPKNTRFCRPHGVDGDARFVPAWRRFMARRVVSHLAPRHGFGCSRRDLGDGVFNGAIQNIWTGDPVALPDS